MPLYNVKYLGVWDSGLFQVAKMHFLFFLKAADAVANVSGLHSESEIILIKVEFGFGLDNRSNDT